MSLALSPADGGHYVEGFEWQVSRMTTRRLAAILAADVVGFSSMMERDEEGTASRIRAVRREVIEPN